MSQISIIIPALQEAHNLANLLPYLLENGQGKIVEIIVADADSQDDTKNIVQKYENQHVTLLDCPKGRAIQMNRAAAMAQGDILYFVHADTFPPKHFVNAILTAKQASKVVGCFPFQFNSTRFLLRINAFFTRLPFLWCRGGDQTLFIKRDLFESLGGFDEKYCIMEEYEFILRVQKVEKFHILEGNVLVSARKYEENGYFRVQIANLIVFNMFRFGYSQSAMLAMYKKILNVGRLSWQYVRAVD